MNASWLIQLVQTPIVVYAVKVNNGVRVMARKVSSQEHYQTLML
jgi:hypothetical protein